MKKKKRWIIAAVILLLILAGGAYVYYAYDHCVHKEPDIIGTETNTDSVYTEEAFGRVVNRSRTLKKYICKEEDGIYDTYVIPGLKTTRTIRNKVEGELSCCGQMTPQGIAITEDYILVSAYCRTKEHNSVIYVLDKQSKEFIKEIVLKNRSHVGGMAYDTMNHNLWITGQGETWAQIHAISLEHLKGYQFEESYEPIEFDLSYNLYRIQRASFMTYHDGALFVGFFTKDNASIIEKYLVNADGTLYEREDMDLRRTLGVVDPVACAISMQVISGKVQGMAFYNNRILLTRSWGMLPSEVQIFNYSRYGILSSSEAYKQIRFPERMEQIYQDGSEIYALFESAAYSYRPSSLNRIDRIIKLNGNLLVY